MNTRPSFPEIGRIRKGEAKKLGENKPGKDLTYFRFDIDRNETEAIAWVKENFPKEPRELFFMLPFRTVEENYYRCREAWVGGGLLHRCSEQEHWEDGAIQFERGLDGKPVVDNYRPEKICELSAIKYINRKTKQTAEAHCKSVGRLKIFFPQMERLVFFTVITTSIHDTENLYNELEGYKNIGPRGLIGVPFILKRVPKKISVPAEDGGRMRLEKWMLHIEVHPKYASKAIRAMTAAADFPMLEAPKNVKAEEWASDEEPNPDEFSPTPPDENLGAEEGEYREETEPEIVYPEHLTVDTYTNFAKKNGVDVPTSGAILKECKMDLKKAWASLLKNHIPQADWPK